MPTRKRMLVLAVVAVAAGAAVVGWWAFTRPPGVTRGGFDRIQAGMTQQEVEAILGGLPGDYTDDSYDRFNAGCCPVEQVLPRADPNAYRLEFWRANGRTVAVFFRTDGTVEDKWFIDFTLEPPPSLFGRIKRRLGL